MKTNPEEKRKISMGNANDCWGGEDKYYSSHSGFLEDRDTLWNIESKKVRLLLKNKDIKLEEKVANAHKSWNSSIRSAIREETGLRSIGRNTQQTVSVKIVDGIPRRLANILTDIDEKVLWLLLHKDTLLHTQKGLEILIKDSRFISELLNKDHKTNHDALLNSSQFNSLLLKELEKWEILKKFREIDEDILGAYFYRIPEIQLYWMAIGLVSFLIGTSVEALAFVVLVHELAHAYHHLGLDIDKNCWNTEHFHKASKYIVEGLAQFYTEQICFRMRGKFPEALIAFERFRDIQSGPYVAYPEWTDNINDAGETIRATMIDTRIKGICEYPEFKEYLNIHKKRFLVK